MHEQAPWAGHDLHVTGSPVSPGHRKDYCVAMGSSAIHVMPDSFFHTVAADVEKRTLFFTQSSICSLVIAGHRVEHESVFSCEILIWVRAVAAVGCHIILVALQSRNKERRRRPDSISLSDSSV